MWNLVNCCDRGDKGTGPRAPYQKEPPTMFICLAICACHLIFFIEESLFVGVINYRSADGSISLKYCLIL